MRRLHIIVPIALWASGCFVMQSKYDRALGVLSDYQTDRLQTEADRDVAVARMQGRLDEKSGELSKTRDQAQAEKEKAAHEKAGLEAEVAASREELNAVRDQRALTEKRMEEWKLLT